MFINFSNWKYKTRLFFERRKHRYSPLFETVRELKIAFLILLLLLAVLIFLDFRIRDKSGFLGNLLAEGHGLLLDVVVFGILIVIYDRVILERRRKIESYLEEIEILRSSADEEVKPKIIGFIKRLNRLGYKGINLSHCDLGKAYLYSVSLVDANLEYANLRDAALIRIGMPGADFSGANFQNARLDEVYGIKCAFANADLRGVSITGESEIRKSSFSSANFLGARLVELFSDDSIFEDANFNKATIRHCIFDAANFRSADLTETTIVGSRFKNAKLINTRLNNAELKSEVDDYSDYYNDLSGADLSDADLEGADLEGVDFTGANLLGATNLTVEQLSKVRSLYQAKLNEEIRREIQKKYPHLLEKYRNPYVENNTNNADSMAK